MTAETAEPPPRAEKIPDAGWSFSRWIFFLALAVAAHLAFVFLFGGKKNPAPRAVANVPQFRFAAAAELIALTDPTLFALPHASDLAASLWRRPPAVAEPTFQWTEPPQFLSPAAETLGATFTAFMQTNRLAIARLDFKPAAAFTFPSVKIASLLPQNSTLQLSDNLARRRPLNLPVAPTIVWNDVIAPSRVQALVAADGTVASVVLLESSECETADQKALELARAARFAPTAGLTLGEITFDWHTVPTNAP